jgi:hypothetical protein
MGEGEDHRATPTPHHATPRHIHNAEPHPTYEQRAQNGRYSNWEPAFSQNRQLASNFSFVMTSPRAGCKGFEGGGKGGGANFLPPLLHRGCFHSACCEPALPYLALHHVDQGLLGNVQGGGGLVIGHDSALANEPQALRDEVQLALGKHISHSHTHCTG